MPGKKSEPYLNLWTFCSLMRKSHCKIHWVSTETILGWTALHGNTEMHTCIHHLPQCTRRYRPHHPHLVVQLPNPFQTTLFSQLHSCSQAATPPKPISTSRCQVFFKAKYNIYCHVYVFLSYLTNVNCLAFIRFLFFLMYHWQVFVCCVPSLIFPISSVIFIAWFCKGQWFSGTHVLCYSITICNLPKITWLHGGPADIQKPLKNSV